MGRKGKWYITVKKIFSSESKEKKDQRSKLKRIWRCGKFRDSDRFDSGQPLDGSARQARPPPPPPTPPPVAVEVTRPDVENEQRNRVYSVALASAVAAEAAAVAAEAAAQVARLTASSTFAGRSREEIAVIKIQTAFRGYMARRRLRALRGLVRLKTLVEGNAVKRQATNTLRCLQTLARVQSQIHSRRVRMTEDNHALQKQQQLKCEREPERSKLGEEWDDRLQTKEQIEANLLNKQEAAIRRERALAYAYSHQWKSTSQSLTPTFTDPSNPHWGWSWLERWMVTRPWENRSNITGDTNNANARRASILERTPPTPQKPSRSISRRSPSTPPSKASSVAGKLRCASPKCGRGQLEDDSRSIQSLQSDRPHRRHSIPGSSVRDDESLASSPALPNYMASTESARAKSRFHSPSTLNDNVETPEKGSLNLAKKRLSFPETDKHSMSPSGGMRRYSGPPKVNTDPQKDVAAGSKQASSDGLAMD